MCVFNFILVLIMGFGLFTFRKYKIQDDVHSLMWSSRNLGQVCVTVMMINIVV